MPRGTPRHTPGVCPQPGCPNLQPCPSHRPQPWAGSTRRARLPRDWDRRKAAVLRRDKRRCYICGAGGCTQVDHVRPGDDHRMSNLAAICDDHHKAKSSAEGNEARWGRGTPSSGDARQLRSGRRSRRR